MTAFDQLHPKIRQVLWDQRWKSLRPLQEEAIPAVLGTDNDLILAAATASGKTEAAFLPILSRLAEDEEERGKADSIGIASVGALYVSPLKALINDQFRRMETLCGHAGIPVHRWHGDVAAGEKKRLRGEPGGVLLITPESLESQFVNHGRDLPRLYPRLRFVVIDELHAFLDDVRGKHLQSLLARLNIAAGCQPRRLGLSATIGDFRPAQAFLNPANPDSVTLLIDKAGEKELLVGVKAFLEPPKMKRRSENEPMFSAFLRRKKSEDEIAAQPDEKPLAGLLAIAADIARHFRVGSNLIFCNNRRHAETLAGELHQIAARERWPDDPFLLHHGSLSRELREEAEAALKSGNPVTALCTSTLEMGIDIGSVRCVGQVGPPGSVASLVQRLGRCGRKEGEARILRFYALDEKPDESAENFADCDPMEPHGPPPSPLTRLYPELVRSVAMVELLLEKWLEPPAAFRLHFSACIHQILSLLRQTGGVPAASIFDTLCTRGAFGNIAPNQLAGLLRGLGRHGLAQQMATGELILAPAGERIVESRDFYAAFAGGLMFTVESGGQAIGVIPATSVPKPGETFVLAGRSWRVADVNERAKRVSVLPGSGGEGLKFDGGAGELHPVILQKMRAILAAEPAKPDEISVPEFPYLAPAARELMQNARAHFRALRLHERDVVETSVGLHWFPWAGTRLQRTLALCARADGLLVSNERLCLTYAGLSQGGLRAHCRKIAGGEFTAQRLFECAKKSALKAGTRFGGASDDLPAPDRFDEYVEPALLEAAFAAEAIDLPEAARHAGAWLRGAKDLQP